MIFKIIIIKINKFIIHAGLYLCNSVQIIYIVNIYIYKSKKLRWKYNLSINRYKLFK